MAADYPSRIDLCPWGFWEHYVGQPTRYQDSTYLNGGMAYASGSLNNEIGWKVFLKSGIWSITFIFRKDATSGIYTIKLDTTTLGTFDGYNSTTTTNNVTALTGITVSTSGVYTLKTVMGSKYASSSSYHYRLLHIVLQRTGA